jgi:hypothetical protein
MDDYCLVLYYAVLAFDFQDHLFIETTTDFRIVPAQVVYDDVKRFWRLLWRFSAE